MPGSRPAVMGGLQQPPRAHDEERPERERPQGAGPVEVARRREAVRDLAQARDVRQMAEVLGLIEPVPPEEAARRVESHEPRLQHQVLGYVLVEQGTDRSEEHTSELQSRPHLVCRLLLEKKKNGGVKITSTLDESLPATSPGVQR